MNDSKRISLDTAISLSLVGTLLFAAFSFGIMYNEFQGVKEKTEKIDKSVSIITEKIQSIELRMRETQNIKNKSYGMAN